MKFENFIISNDALFHFTDRITFLEKIIPSKVLLLNQLKNTKDPQEYKKYEFAPTSFVSTSDLRMINRIHNEINDYFKNFVQIACFCTTKKNELRNIWQKPKIWSDFGDGHKGICLIFSNTALKSELNKIDIYNDIKNVTYNFNSKMLPTPDLNLYKKIGSLKYCKQYVKDNIVIILQKDLDYEDENERRCFAISKNSNRIKINLNRTLKGLIIGDRFPLIYFDVLKLHSKKTNIELYKNNYQAGIGYNLIKYN